MKELILYHHPLSLCSQIARLTLVEKEIPWTSRIIDIALAHENCAPWYLRLNPQGNVPTLVHQGQVITHASDIIRYLDKEFPARSLSPLEPRAKKEMESWLRLQERFPLQQLSYGRFRGVKGTIGRHVLKRQLQALQSLQYCCPDLHDVYEEIINDVRTCRKISRNRKSIRQLSQDVIPLLDRLELRLKDHEWLAGKSYSLADVVWTVVLARLELLRFEKYWRNGHRPALEHYIERVKFRPSFNEAELKTHIRYLPTSFFWPAMSSRIPLPASLTRSSSSR